MCALAGSPCAPAATGAERPARTPNDTAAPSTDSAAEQAGILHAAQAPPPVATTLYRLTDRGEALEPVVKAIGAWARPLLEQTDERDAFQSHSAVLPFRFYLEDTRPDGPPAQIQLETDDEPIVVEANGGQSTHGWGGPRPPTSF